MSVIDNRSQSKVYGVLTIYQTLWPVPWAIEQGALALSQGSRKALSPFPQPHLMAPLAPIFFRIHIVDTEVSASSHTLPSSVSPRLLSPPLPPLAQQPVTHPWNITTALASLPPASFPSSLVCISPDELSRKTVPCSTSQSLIQQIFVKSLVLPNPQKISLCVSKAKPMPVVSLH